jgi:PAS domain S-box-containing protein
MLMNAGAFSDEVPHQELIAEVNRLRETCIALEQARLEHEDRDEHLHQLRIQIADLQSQNQSLRENQDRMSETLARYRELFDFAPVGYFTFDARGTVLDANLTGATMIGRRREEIIGSDFAAVAPLSDRTALRRMLYRCIESRDPSSEELALLTLTGHLEVHASARPVFSASRRVDACRVALVDISARKRIEKELRATRDAEQRLRSRFEALDRAGRAAFASLLDSGGAGLRTLLELVADQARDLAGARYAAVGLSSNGADACTVWAESGTSSSAPPNGTATSLGVPIMCKGRTLGKLYIADKESGAEFSREDERVIEMLADRVCTAIEISRLGEIERRENARLRFLTEASFELSSSLDYDDTLHAIAKLAVGAIADACSIVVFATDDGEPECVVTEVAPGHTALFERLRGAASTHPRALFESAAEAQRVCSDVPGASLRQAGIHTRMLLPLELRGRRVGEIALVREATSPRYAATDVPLAREIALRAASAIENALLYGRATRALHEREDLLAFVSHDLGNVLNAIKLCAGLLDQEPSLGARKQGGRIAAACDRATRLIRDLLTSAALEAGAFALANVTAHPPDALVTAAIADAEPTAAAKAVRLEAQVPDGLPQVHADRERVLQVLGNLLENAIKFSPRGGAVVVSGVCGGEEVTFSVRDSGPGIRDEDSARIFDRYWRGRGNVPGTGLGLCIAKGIVERHGGFIRAANATDGGGLFEFTLPVATMK